MGIPNTIVVTDAPYNAKCDNATDDVIAIRNAINDLAPGGKLILPGLCRVSDSLVVTKSITITGHGLALSGLNSQSDINVLRFEPGPNMDTCHVEKISIFGGQRSDAAHSVLGVGVNMCVHLRDLRVWGGNSALFDQGVDGDRDNCFFSGAGTNGGAVTSNGANWWRRCKIDSAFGHQAWAFFQGSPLPIGGVMENHFDQCDFSGDYGNSVLIEDGGTQSAITVFDGCVLSSPVSIVHARWTAFTGCELGSSINAGDNPVTVGDSYGFGGITVAGTQRALANNIGIT